MAKEGSAEATIREIKRKTRRKYNAEQLLIAHRRSLRHFRAPCT
jgi:molybdopterin synthase catalytic subunit